MTAQEVIKNFMTKLTNHGCAGGKTVGTDMLDVAIKASSRFSSAQNVIAAMKADQIQAEREAVEEVLGSEYAGKTMSAVSSKVLTSAIKSQIVSRKTNIFLQKYCGIILGNDDTGAITGSDANISLTAGDVIYGKTFTAEDLQTLAAQDGMTLSDDTLIIGTGIEKNQYSVVPEIGNLYTAASEQAQSISTGVNDWIVVATDSDDTVLTGGADSIVAGAGNDSIKVGADYASIVTGVGSDTVNLSADVANVTLEDLNSDDALTISGTFEVGKAATENTVVIVTDKTGTRQIRLGDFDNAQNAAVNGTTIANWLSTAGVRLSTLTSSAASSGAVASGTSAGMPISDDGTIKIEDDDSEEFFGSAAAAEENQILSTPNSAVDLNEVSITGGEITSANGNKLGNISSEFPNITSFTKNGLTITLEGVTSNSAGQPKNIKAKTLDQLTDDQRTIVAGLFKWWAKECTRLNEESYGIGFNSPTAKVKDINLYFYNGSNNYLAVVYSWYSSTGNATQLKMTVNMKYYKDLSDTNVDGSSSTGGSFFLDRTLSHEFTHAIMGTNITWYYQLPQFIKEGMAELTHGIDDERRSSIYELANNASKLNSALNLKNTGTGTTDAYAGGYMFLRYFAKQAALMELADFANPDLEGSWTISGTTATYSVGGKDVAIVKGLKSGLAPKGNSIEGITVEDGVITLSKRVVDTSKITLTLKNGGNYILALGDDIADSVVTIGNKVWTVAANKGTATLKGDASAGYALSGDGKTITYTAAKTGQTLATVSGLAKNNFTASDFDATGNVITLKKSMVGTSNVTVKGDGYTLALSDDGNDAVSEPETQPEYWSVSKTTATYKQDTTAGFTLTNDDKTATYSKPKTVTLATVSGIKKVTTDNQTDILNAISIDADKKITLDEDALSTSKITVKGTDYTITAVSDWMAPETENRWLVNKTTATYDTIKTPYFEASTNNKTLTYKKETKVANLITVKGLAKGAAVDNDGNVAGITLDDTTVTLADKQYFGKKVEVTLASGYTLDNQLAAPTATKTYWAVKKGSAVLKQDLTDGYTLTTNSKGVKTLTYSAANTATVTTVSGLDKTLTDTNGELDGLTYDLTDKVVTADTRVLTSSNVSIKGNSYTLALADEGDYIPRTSAVKDSIWSVSGTTATYKEVYLDYFTRKNDTAFTYKKQTDIQTLAKVSGLRNNASLDSISIDGGVITLTEDAFVTSPNAKTKIALTTKEDYTLKLDDGIANVEYNAPAWSYSNGKANYVASVKTAGYLPADDAMTITYIPKNATKTYATLSGVKSASGISTNDDVISLTEASLNKTKVTLTTTEDYTLALGDDSLAAAPVDDETWAKNTSKATATLSVTMSPGYMIADEKTITYSSKNTTKTLAQIGGINKNADIATFQAVADGDTKKISLSAAQLGKTVTVSGVYEFDFASDYNNAAITGSATADNISVAGANLTITGGKGNDSIDLGTGGNNLFVYATGDGKDVIADFTATDKLKISKGTPSVDTDDTDVVVTVDAGSITLTDAAGQTISILDKNNKATAYTTTAYTTTEDNDISAADLLLSDNYTVSATLSEIVKPAAISYTPYDFTVDLSLTKEEKFAPALTYGDKK